MFRAEMYNEYPEAVEPVFVYLQNKYGKKCYVINTGR